LNKKGQHATACISHCWQRVAVVITLGCLVVTRPQSALATCLPSHSPSQAGRRNGSYTRALGGIMTTHATKILFLHIY